MKPYLRLAAWCDARTSLRIARIVVRLYFSKLGVSKFILYLVCDPRFFIRLKPSLIRKSRLNFIIKRLGLALAMRPHLLFAVNAASNSSESSRVAHLFLRFLRAAKTPKDYFLVNLHRFSSFCEFYRKIGRKLSFFIRFSLKFINQIARYVRKARKYKADTQPGG